MDDVMKRALDEVAAERQRQIEVEGWTPEHDMAHCDGELARAASAYAWVAGVGEVARDNLIRDGLWLFPFHRSWWKPKTRRRDLIRAGACIVAELERLYRKERTGGDSDG